MRDELLFPLADSSILISIFFVFQSLTMMCLDVNLFSLSYFELLGYVD